MKKPLPRKPAPKPQKPKLTKADRARHAQRECAAAVVDALHELKRAAIAFARKPRSITVQKDLVQAAMFLGGASLLASAVGANLGDV